MKTSLDKLMIHAAWIYIILPFLLFCIGWLRWYYSAAMVGILLLSYIFSIKSTIDYVESDLKKHRRKILIAFSVISIVVLFSGIGEYCYQVEDHQFRNSILHDLISHRWPFRLNEKGNVPEFGRPILYIYYINFWLPAALIGKLLGLNAANIFLYLWTIAGITFTFYFLCRYLKKFSLRILFVFFFFNSLYLIVSFFKYPFSSILSSDYQIWSGDMVLAGSSLDALFWIYNQTVTPWLILIMIMNNFSKQNTFFLYALCYLHGPFIFLGFFPFLIIQIINMWEKNVNSYNAFWANIKPYLSFQNLVAAPAVLAISYFYLSGSSAVQSLFLEHVSIIKYAVFCTISFGIISLLIFPRYKKDPNFYLIVFILMVLPLIGMGTVQPMTFCARVSLAPQFILLILVARYIIEEGNSFMKKLVITYIILGAIEPGLEFGRSVVFSVGYYIDPAGMNKYLLNRTTGYNTRVNMLPPKPDLKKENFLILDYNASLDRPGNQYTTYFKYQKDNTVFSKYLLKQ